MTPLGVNAITGKPYKPSTQGKSELFHWTAFPRLDKRPLAFSYRKLQELVDRFDQIYITKRSNQGLPEGITPQQSWDAAPVAEAPRPPAIPVLAEPLGQEPAALPPALQARVQPLVDDGTEAPDRNTTTVLDPEIQLATSASGKIGGTVRHPEDAGAREPQVYSNSVVKIGSTMSSPEHAHGRASRHCRMRNGRR